MSSRISLRSFDERDLSMLDIWRREIRSEQYMERLHPAAFESTGLEGLGIDFAWYVIEDGGEPVGSVWIERRRNDPSVGVLGIVIGRTSSLGRGIGTQAIRKAVPMARRLLGFDRVRLLVRKSNPRAVACYRKCGFTITGEGSRRLESAGSVAFYRMELELGVPLRGSARNAPRSLAVRTG